jgi:hypothetical protein
VRAPVDTLAARPTRAARLRDRRARLRTGAIATRGVCHGWYGVLPSWEPVASGVGGGILVRSPSGPKTPETRPTAWGRSGYRCVAAAGRVVNHGTRAAQRQRHGQTRGFAARPRTGLRARGWRGVFGSLQPRRHGAALTARRPAPWQEGRARRAGPRRPRRSSAPSRCRSRREAGSSESPSPVHSWAGRRSSSRRADRVRGEGAFNVDATPGRRSRVKVNKCWPTEPVQWRRS